MSIAAPTPPPAPREAEEHISKAGIFVLGLLVSAVISAPVGFYSAKWTNTTQVLQQQSLTEVQNFETTGGALDNSMRRFSDALVTGKDVEGARDALRDAISQHTSVVFAMRDTIGAGYVPYMANARELRTLADAENPREAVKTWQAAIDLIAKRKLIAGRIKKSVEAA